MYPGKLVIPGTEVTTYHGHYNSIGSSAFPDFRGGRVLAYPSMEELAPATVPASQLAPLRAAGGWTQINHPTIFPGAPTVCRGCPWDWTMPRPTTRSVDAIEVQTGPADIGATQNPFTKTAIAFYEARLATGAHIAAVGSSDSHQADQADVTSAPIGRAATVVYASELSKPAIVQGIRDDHTYVKPYGNDGPDIRVTARSPGAPNATLGDTISGPELGLEVQVLRAGPGATRPGTYFLELLRNGTAIDRVTIAGDDFTHDFAATEAGRYSIQVLREAAGRQPLRGLLEPGLVRARREPHARQAEAKQAHGRRHPDGLGRSPGRPHAEGQGRKDRAQDRHRGRAGEAEDQAEGQAQAQAPPPGQGEGEGEGVLRPGRGRAGERGEAGEAEAPVSSRSTAAAAR